MIPRTTSQCQTPARLGRARWPELLAESVREPLELFRLVGIEPTPAELAAATNQSFPLLAPRPYLDRIEQGNRSDPLLRQLLPASEELTERHGFITDPVGDLASLKRGRILHKYRGRALLLLTPTCAIHCRFCFRRSFPYHSLTESSIDAALDLLAADRSLSEVVLSGGDPLLLPDARLAAIAGRLDQIPHLQRLRIHTRLPVVLPQRVDGALLGWLGAGRLRRVVVIHCNHPAELDSSVAEAMARLTTSGATLLNQGVLLHGVNDSAETLIELQQRLFDCGVLPYYLHQLDRAQGVGHFEVSDRRAIELHRQLQESLPGYLVPRLVREVAGERSKRLLFDEGAGQ